jgi:DNA-binding NarL/FixJ family response regulator
MIVVRCFVVTGRSGQGPSLGGPEGDRLVDNRVVLIVSADEGARRTVGRRFKRAGYATAEIETGEDAISTATGSDPLLVVLDLDLTDTTGYEVCHELRQQFGQDLPIILVSGERTESSDRVAGLLLGGDDYLTKPLDPDELLVRARRLLTTRPSARLAADATLTGREVQVLQLLADGKSQDRIAKELFISTKTVGTHIQRILTKLGVHSRTEAVALAFRSGLIERPTSEAG